MILLDMRTIVFGYLLTQIACLLVIVLLWWQNRQRFAGTTFWVVSFVLQTLAFFLFIIYGSVPGWVSVFLPNVLLLAGALLIYMGFLRFTGEKSVQVNNYVILALLILILAYFTFFEPDLHAGSITISTGLLIICFQCMWLMLYRVPAVIKPLTRSVGIIFIVYCLINIVRIIQFFTVPQETTDFFHPAFFDKLVPLSYQMALIFLTYSLALMVNKHLYMEVAVQEEKFSKAFHSAPYMITITSLSDGLIIEANDRFAEDTGYSLKEIKGKTKIDLHLWEKKEDRTWVISELAKTGSVHEHEFRFRKKSGEMMTGLLSAETLTINNEKCIMTTVNDITLRKKAADTLRETRDYLKNLLNYANAPIIVWDNKLRITKFNNAFERLSGRNEQQVLGSEVDILFPLVTQKQSLEYIKKTGTGEHWDMVEIDIQHVDGSVRTLLWNSAAVYSADGKTIIATVAQGQDITERKAAQEEIRWMNAVLERKVAEQTKELLDKQQALLNLVEDLNQTANNLTSANQSMEALNKELAAFGYSLSHDLRAPLRTIEGFSNALLEDYNDKLDAQGKDYLERIRKGTKQMGWLINDMLKLSRINRSELIRQPIDLSAMAEEIAREKQENSPDKIREVIIRKNIVISGDHYLIKIALQNLMDNAWKFTGKEEHPRIELGTTSKEGKTIIFLRDNGVGFDMTYMDKLFGIFQRLHQADEFPGTGIGLATVQRVINRHGGKIWAQGEVGKGATFFFTLET